MSNLFAPSRHAALAFLLVFACLGSASTPEADVWSQPHKVAIFSAGYGKGHNTSAFKIKALLERVFPKVEVKIFYAENYHPIVGRWPWVSALSTYVFDRAYQLAPKRYDRIFQMAMNSAEDKTSAGQIPNVLFSSEKVLESIEDFQPDVIYSTYHILTSVLIRLRESGRLSRKIRIAWLDTDFVLKKFFSLHSLGVDLTFIAHRFIYNERLKEGVPAEKMALTGLPINDFASAPFSDAERRDFMREAMSLPDQEGETEIWINGEMQSITTPAITLDPDVMTVTIASGRAGAGDYPAIVKGLIREAKTRGKKIQIIAVCGESKKNYARVTKAYRKMAAEEDLGDVKLVVSRLVDNAKLLKLVRSSQLFIGKSGSQSPFEAAVMGIARVLIDIIGGQERWTADLFRRVGLAEVVAAENQDQLAELAFKYIEDDERMATMREADQDIRDSYDPTPIVRFFEDSVRALDREGPVIFERRPPKWYSPRGVRQFCQRLLR